MNTAQIGADHECHNCPSLPKAKLIENVKEKWFTGCDKLGDHVFAGWACFADSFGKAGVEGWQKLYTAKH